MSIFDKITIPCESLYDKTADVYVYKMTEGRQDATIMVAYLAQKERTDEALLSCIGQARPVAVCLF